MNTQKLFEEYKYKVELHTHTSPVSACSQIEPEALVHTYKELGCDAVVITNHLSPVLFSHEGSDEDKTEYYLSDYRRAKAEGDKIGIKVILGFEFRLAENNNDYLIYGVKEEDALPIYKYMTGTLKEFREGYKNPDMLFLQAHPFRDGMTQMDVSLLDGIEVFNMHPGHNSRVSLAAKYASDNHLVTVGGSDYHHHGLAGLIFARFKTLPRDSVSLAKLLRSGDYIFDLGGHAIVPNR